MKTLTAVIACLTLLGIGARSHAQTQLVSDDFSGANGTYLDSNWTGCGYNNGAYTKLVYESNASGGSGFWGQDCALYTGYGVFPSDQYATATIVASVPSSTAQASIQLRANATAFSDEAYIACGWDSQDFPADPHYRIWSLGPGASGPVSLWLSNITPAVNDVVTCQVLGNTVSMTLNGQRVASVTDASGNNTGYPGLYYVDPSGSGPTPTDIIFANFKAGNGPPVESSQIDPASATVLAGSFAQYDATVTYTDGTTTKMSNWLSSDPSVATIDVTGTAFGAVAGTATVTGSAGPDSLSSTIAVQARDGYSPLIHDTFVGAAGVYLGTNWTGCGYDGGAYSELVYENNQAGGSGYGSQDCAVYTGRGVFPSDQFATATVAAQFPASTPEASVELRATAAAGVSESYIACGWDAQDFAADQHYRIWSLGTNGTPTSLYLSTVTPMKNDVIWCQVLGHSITMQVNGKTIAVVNDTSGLTSGYPGLYYIDPNQDVPPITDVIFDNFAAGSISQAVVATITVSPASAKTTANSSVQFTATGTYTDGTSGDITSSVSWISSNPAVATINTTGLAAAISTGSTTITASSGLASGSASLSVNLLTPTVTFSPTPSTAPYLSTFSVNATTNASVMPSITGTVGVCSVGSVTGTPAAATAVVTMLSGTGTCSMTANWPAGGAYTSAGPITQTTTATKIAPTVAFTGAPSSAGYGTSFNVTASTNASTIPSITGTSGVCTAGTVGGAPSSSTATITMISSSGTCTVTASWPADANFTAPSSKTQKTTGTKAATSTTIISQTPNPSTRSQAVAMGFSVTGGGATPTGSVTVSASTGESCSATLSSGTGGCSITFTSSGTRTLTAHYGGSTNFNTSTSAAVSQSVNSPTVSLSPTSINFGSVTRGTSQTRAETISNTGTGALINLSWKITGLLNLGQFSIASSTCGSTLNPGQSCVINLMFKPTLIGTQSATLSLTDNATTSPQTVALSGSVK